MRDFPFPLRTRLSAALCACTLAIGLPVLAQDETEPMEAASTPIETTGDPLKPRASEMMPRTAKSLLLDVVNTGARVVAVGDRGSIVVSSNGVDWAQVEVPVRATLTGVSFADENNGWAVGHDATILNTRDGGRTWQMQNFEPELEKPFLDVMFLDASTGYALGAYGLFYKTTDGGATWAQDENALPITENEGHLNAIVQLGDGSLFVAGEAGLLAATRPDGSWEVLPSPYEGSLFSALPIGEKGALITGLRGNAFRSEDVRSGQWTPVETSTLQSLMKSTELRDGRIAMVGVNGVVLIMDDAGSISRVNVRQDTGMTSSGSFSGVINWNGGILAVGESGAMTIAVR
ncbi:MAG TPA: YCF48-related protein [Nevskiaceae bacterium]|nr:YCF48-related protein [Nevskiaceae bacterium]